MNFLLSVKHQLASLCYPTRKSKSSRDPLAVVFPRFASATCLLDCYGDKLVLVLVLRHLIENRFMYK